MGAIIAYIALLTAGIYGAVILGMLTSLAGNQLLAVATPSASFVIEFILIPWLLKYASRRDKKIAEMKSFVAEDRHARDSFDHLASSWGWGDWLVLIILIHCFAAKAMILITFGVYQPVGLLIFNWAIAAVDFCLHLSGLTTRVPCFIGSRISDAVHLSKRLNDTANSAGKDGTLICGALVPREYPFVTTALLRTGVVDGHELLYVRSDDQGHHYLLRSPGTLDDADRSGFLNSQANHAAQADLARALARIQLEQLTADPMRSLQPSSAAPMDPVPELTSTAVRPIVTQALGVIFVAFSFSACVDRSSTNGSTSNDKQVHLVITQPAEKSTVPIVVEALQRSFTKVAQDSNGTMVPLPTISIIHADGKATQVAAPGADGVAVSVFGPNSPKARKMRLDGQLETLRAKLVEGCGGKPLTDEVLKATPHAAFKAEKFDVWAVAGGDDVWQGTDAAHGNTIEDAGVFEAHVATLCKTGGNIVIVADKFGDARLSDATAHHQTDATHETKGADEKPSGVTIVQPRGGDNIIIGVNVPAMKSNPANGDRNTPPLEVTSLPAGVEPVGGPITFPPGSAKISREGLESVKDAAERMKTIGAGRTFVVGSADHTKSEEANLKLSRERAAAVAPATNHRMAERVAVGLKTSAPGGPGAGNGGENRPLRRGGFFARFSTAVAFAHGVV
jgi:outer membrane protein OmpA-like peptidoglycan-associated protein